MSIATATQTIAFRSKSGAYTAYIACNKGDWYQYYRDGGATFFPDYEAMASNSDPCELAFVAYSSLSTAEVPCVGLNVFVGEGSAAIQFGANNVSTGAYAGFLKLVPPPGNAGQWKVQVLKNPIAFFGTTSFSLRFEALASTGGTNPEELKAYVNCAIQQSGSSDLKATISEDPDSEAPRCNYIISRQGQKVRLKVTVADGETDATASYSYRWLMQDPAEASGWRAIPAMSGTTVANTRCEVAEGDVQSYAAIKVEAIKEGRVVASDVQGIWDAQDPLRINIGADTDELWFDEGDTSKVITFKPWVTDATASCRYPEYKTFRFALIDAVGTIMNSDANTDVTIDNTSDATYAAAAGWPLTYAPFQDFKSSVELLITAM